MTDDFTSPCSASEEWLTVTECVVRLGKADRTVRNWIRQLPPSAIRRRRGAPLQANLQAIYDLLESRKLAVDEPDSPSTASDSQQGLAKTVQVLEEEVAFLRAEVERHHQADAENRRLMLADRTEIARLREQLALAPALQEAIAEREAEQDGETHTQAENDAGKGARRAWWQIWRRT